jgi:hypothetical protein
MKREGTTGKGKGGERGRDMRRQEERRGREEKI